MVLKEIWTLDDIKNNLGTRITSELANKLNVNSIEEIPNALEETGLELEDLYANIRKEQLANEAIRLGVSKEGYKKYEAKYTKDWLLADSLSASRKSNNTIENFGTLQTYSTQQRNTAEDLQRNASNTFSS